MPLRGRLGGAVLRGGIATASKPRGNGSRQETRLFPDTIPINPITVV